MAEIRSDMRDSDKEEQGGEAEAKEAFWDAEYKKCSIRERGIFILMSGGVGYIGFYSVSGLCVLISIAVLTAL